MKYYIIYNRGDNMECTEKTGSCVCDILKFIRNLQQDTTHEKHDVGCTRAGLGNSADNNEAYNTRPFVLFLENGSMFEAFYKNDCAATNSYIFRVEKIHNCCARLRVLKLESSDGEVAPIFENIYNPAISIESTDNFVTVNANCFCGLECLRDIKLDFD